MITEYSLKELLDRYKLDADKIIDNNDNILTYGEYRDIEDTIKYLHGKKLFNVSNNFSLKVVLLITH